MKFVKKRAVEYVNSFEEADRIVLLRSGQHYFNSLIQLIESAQKIIHLQMYILNDDAIGNIVLDALINARKRGVDIFVVADGFGSNQLTNTYKEKLIQAGINFRIFSRISLFKNLSIGRRMHHKIVVADGQKALVGGINIADKYYGPDHTEPWLDFAVFLEGNVSKKLEKICYQIEEKKYYLSRNPSEKYKAKTRPILINIRQNDWLRNKKQVSQSYHLAIRNAEKSIVIFASYFLPGLRLRLALEAASRRGVKITLVLPGISDIPLALNATYFLYYWLLKNNMRIFEWKKSVLHAKIAIVDDEWMTVGSFNLNVLSTYASIESNVDILDKDFVKNARSVIDKIIEEGCEEITIHRKRPFLTRIRERIAYFLGRTLIKTITFFPTFKNFYSRMVD